MAKSYGEPAFLSTEKVVHKRQRDSWIQPFQNGCSPIDIISSSLRLIQGNVRPGCERKWQGV
jgi:hypothetical protein